MRDGAAILKLRNIDILGGNCRDLEDKRIIVREMWYNL